MKLFGGLYHGRKVLLTGHTGFKGSWLALWLTQLGAEVSGVALPPDTNPNHWDLLKLDMPDHRLDIRDYSALESVVKNIQPEIVLHLAAQPLVRRSYREPLETWATNVMGTANLFEACRNAKSVRAIVAVTTDKCYENKEWDRGYNESDRLGGHDPYSASKAAAELVAASYRSAFFHEAHSPLLATARAGNVIGGGDWSEDRLIPDLVRAIACGKPLEIRSPQATRPWQHVLESLSGYLLLGQGLLEGRKEFAQAWNFGPAPEDNRSVAEILARLKIHWPELDWKTTDRPQPHEAGLLYLDSSKAHTRLGWQPTWSLDDALTATAEWYRAYLLDGHIESRSQLAAFIAQAQIAQREWAA
ncbi:MAG: CDP-glucose 4,6-dehydratase [Gammaproteobacteria bacterium]|nr:CDP-glucose 4,6-dehydratase [Gammaproteobacteria bacterium]